MERDDEAEEVEEEDGEEATEDNGADADEGKERDDKGGEGDGVKEDGDAGDEIMETSDLASLVSEEADNDVVENAEDAEEEAALRPPHVTRERRDPSDEEVEGWAAKPAVGSTETRGEERVTDNGAVSIGIGDGIC